MAGSGKWKSVLVSTGLPLEFDVARLCANRGYYVFADYAYARQDMSTFKDFSVDLRAQKYARPDNVPFPPRASIELLIECKHRLPSTKWLFFPQIFPADHPVASTWHAMRTIDQFYYHHTDWTSVREFSEALPIAFKGTEVNLEKGDVYDKEIRHGIAQLQYALPAYFNQLLRSMSATPSAMFVPYLVCPILLTTAELYLVGASVALQEFDKLESLEDVAAHVPYLCYSAIAGPDFQRHCRQQGEGLVGAWPKELLQSVDSRASDVQWRAKPSSILNEMEAGSGSVTDTYYRDIVVCSYAAFPSLLDVMEQAVSKAIMTQSIS